MTSGACEGTALISGAARGEAVVLAEPLSLWGGMDPLSGRIIDRRHPQAGAELAGRILVMPSGRGSSSSSSVLAEAIRVGTAPAGIVLRAPDGIIVLGALVARELYGRSIPVVALGPGDYALINTGDELTIDAGTVVRRPATPP